ncbi:hypothetical protein PENTCL1PPCAC_12647, partial [Pristionchus entomophagus]
EVTYGQWSAVLNSASKVFKSDFVHSSCHMKDNDTNIVEEFVHLQMWKEEKNSTESTQKNDETDSAQNSTTEDKTKDERPNVFIIVLDSVATSQGLRSLPKTIEMM